MAKVTVKGPKVVTLPSVKTSAPAQPKVAGSKLGKKNALAALFGKKRSRPSVSNVPTRTQAL